MDYENLRVAVMGLGKSGVALAKVLTEMGARVLVSDSRPAELLHDSLVSLEGLAVELELGGHTERLFANDLVVVSPGVSVLNDWVQGCLKRGVEVIGEVEMAWRLSKVPFIAVTGTNGKSTTVTLIDRMLGQRSILAGNIGLPLVAEVAKAPENGFVVAEVSSFQLETVNGFRPHVSVLTNVTPDHLDRHTNYAEYFAAKARLFAQQNSQDLALFNADDPEAMRMAGLLRSQQLPAWLPGYKSPVQPACPQVMTFSQRGEVDNGSWYSGGHIYYRNHGPAELVVDWDFAGLSGPHNLSNGLGAIAVAKFLGVDNDSIKAALEAHRPLHYRMQEVRQLDGVRFVNDSKGTNPSSVVAALHSFAQPIVLIAGGKDKGVDFTELAQAINSQVKLLVLIGEAAERLQENVLAHGQVPIKRCNSLQEAVVTSYKNASADDVVLLSPACSSFDMFANAEERGRSFDECVLALQ